MPTSEQQSLRLSLALKGAKIGLWDWNIKENRIYFDANYFLIAGYEPDEFSHTYAEWKKRVHPDDIAQVERVIQQYLAGELESYVVEFRFKTKTDDWMWILDQGEIVERDKDGNPVRFIGLHMDISQRKQAEEALKESQRYTRGLIEANADALVTISVKGKITDVNIASELITGVSRKEIIGTDFSNYFTDPDAARKGYQQVFQEGYVRDYPLEIKHRDGRVTPVLYNASVYKDAQGNVAGVFAAARDITEHKQAEDALSEANNIINRSSAVAFLWENSEGWPVEFVSENVEKLFGYSAQDFLEGKISYSEIIHRNDLERVGEEVVLYSKKEGLQTFAHDPYRIITKNGEIKWVDDRTYIRRDSRGMITHYEGIVYDITERKQAKDALQESELRFRMLADYTYDWEYWINPDGKYIYLSPSCERITGYSPEELISNPHLLFDMIPPDYAEKFHQHYEDEANPETPVFSMVVPIITKNGEERWLEHNCSPVFDGQGHYAGRLGNNRDITEKKKAEEALQELDQAKSDFISIVAHELRTPLTVIAGYAELLGNAGNPLLEEKKENCFSIIQSNTEVLKRLIDDLLDIGRIQIDHPLGIVPQETDLDEIIEKAVASAKVKGQQCKIIVAHNNTLPETLWIDGNRITQVLNNLLSNAIKYSPHGGTVKVQTMTDEEKVTVAIQDQGMGMTPQQVEHIFDRFYRAESSNLGITGLGLGMTIVKQIIVDHGGEISVSSHLGEGTTIAFTLPRRRG
ncbi:MAG: PAS domain S-box protein [Desulfuromonadales bacterium]|nr:PAS domain S-box protein [Desulfuromonadales bacterium]